MDNDGYAIIEEVFDRSEMDSALGAVSEAATPPTRAHAPAWALERVVALRVHLDDSTAANGPLRVLPGTHVHGVMTGEQIDRVRGIRSTRAWCRIGR